MPTWSGARVAVLGGEVREWEVIRSFLERGCTVTTYGVVPNEQYAHLARNSAVEAVSGVDVIVAPVPGVGANDILYSTHAPEPIQVNRKLLAAAKPRAFYLSGRATPTIRAAGKEFGIRFRDLGEDDYMQVMHCIPTTEGAIAITVRETDHTIHNSDALVVGYGRMGVLLAKNLRGLGARVTVAARRPEVRVRAFADGNAVCDTAHGPLSEAIAKVDLVYNTAPGPVLPREVLQHARKGILVMDLASPPGGIEHEAAKEVGLKMIWARAQAGTAPRHSGRAQFDVMARILDEEWGRDD